MRHLLPDNDNWDAALAVLEEGRDFDRGERWGVYNIQRLYLEFLAALGVREETVPGDPVRRELVFYQLGKFSQAISDFEAIYFNTDPARKYEGFANWLEHQAPDYYAESDADVGYATPDAVTLTTVHQADPDRYRGTVDDETRLFYVAVTRTQKYLFVSFSPGSNQLYRKRSVFFDHCASQQWFLTRDTGVSTAAPRLEPRARDETPKVALSFSELKYLFECPYQFKLRFLYGFNPPLHEALGYGKGLHDALSEVHKRALAGEILGADEADDLVDRHLHAPYAYPALRQTLRDAAVKSVQRYLDEQGSTLERTVHSEKEIQMHVAPGITVSSSACVRRSTTLATRYGRTTFRA